MNEAALAFGCAMTLKVTVLILLLLAISVIASDGDERKSFVQCVDLCIKRMACKLNLILRASGWSCLADCKYTCMRTDLTSIREAGEKVVQYYGKWPFVRVLGAQELFSVLFSLGNMFANLFGYQKIYSKAPRILSWMHRIYFVHSVIAVNCWLQSAIFHYRDLPMTEKLDYFSACLCICFTLPVVIIRAFEIKRPIDQLKVFIPVLCLYLQHIWYMTFVSFDYGYNVKFNAVIGLSSNVLWLFWARKLIRSGRKALGWQVVRFVLASLGSSLLVAIDFPPFFDLIDMHALWHLSTIPVTLMWYHLISSDQEPKRK